MREWTLWIYLRTWVYSFSALSYAFTGSFIYTLLLTWLAELVQTCAYFYPIHETIKDRDAKENMRMFRIDVGLSFVFGIVSSFFIVILEYVFNCVSFIGDTRALAYVGLYLLLCGMRFSLLIEGMYGVVFFIFLAFFGVLFIVILTDNNFYGDTRTMTIVTTYVMLTALLAIVFFLLVSFALGPNTKKKAQLEYIFFPVHALIMTIVFVTERGLHSERSFSYYMHH